MKKRTPKQRLAALTIIIMLLGLSAGYCYVDTDVATAKASTETEAPADEPDDEAAAEDEGSDEVRAEKESTPLGDYIEKLDAVKDKAHKLGWSSDKADWAIDVELDDYIAIEQLIKEVESAYKKLGDEDRDLIEAGYGTSQSDVRSISEALNGKISKIGQEEDFTVESAPAEPAPEAAPAPQETEVVAMPALDGASVPQAISEHNTKAAPAAEAKVEEVIGNGEMEDKDAELSSVNTLTFTVFDHERDTILHDGKFSIKIDGNNTNYFVWSPKASNEILTINLKKGAGTAFSSETETPVTGAIDIQVTASSKKITIAQEGPAPKYHKEPSQNSLDISVQLVDPEETIKVTDYPTTNKNLFSDPGDGRIDFSLLYKHYDSITVKPVKKDGSDIPNLTGASYKIYTTSTPGQKYTYKPDDGYTLYVSEAGGEIAVDPDNTKIYTLPAGVELNIVEDEGFLPVGLKPNTTPTTFTLKSELNSETDVHDGTINTVNETTGYKKQSPSEIYVRHDEYPKLTLKPVNSSGGDLGTTEATYTIWNANDTTTDATTATDFIADATSAYTMYIHPTTTDGKIQKDDTNHIYVLPANGKYHITETYLDSKYSKATGRCDFEVAQDGTITLAASGSTSAAGVYETTATKGELKINHAERNFIDFNVIDILKDTRAFTDGVFTFKSDNTTSDAVDITYDASKYKLEVVTGDKITTDKVGDLTIIQLPATHKITITEKTPPKSCFTLGTSKKELSFKPTATGTVGATTDITGAVTAGEGFYVEDKAIKVKYPRRLGVRISDLSGNSVGTMKVTVTPGTGENVTFAGDYGISQERLTENSPSFTLLRGSGTSAKTETYTYPVTLKFGATAAYSATTVATATTTTATHNSVAANTITVAADGTVSGTTALTELAVTAAATTPGYYYDPAENIITIRHSAKDDKKDPETVDGIKVKLYPADSNGDGPDTKESAFKTSDYEYQFREFQGDDDDFKKLSSSEKTLDGAKSADWGSWQKMTKLDTSTWVIDDTDLTGDTYYQLKEVTTPKDYDTDDEGVIFKYDTSDGVKKNSVEGQGEEANTDSKSDYTYDTLNLYNTKDGVQTGKLEYIYVNKFAVGGTTMLSDAKFTLYEGNAPARSTSSSSSSSSSSTSTTTSSSGGTAIKSWVSSSTNPDSNKLVIKTLNLKTNTTYTIRETAAPTGYQTPTVDWQFRLGTDGWIVSTGTSSSLCTIGTKNNTITIYNQPGKGPVPTADRRKLALWLDLIVVALGGLYLSGFSIFENLPKNKGKDKGKDKDKE